MRIYKMYIHAQKRKLLYAFNFPLLPSCYLSRDPCRVPESHLMFLSIALHVSLNFSICMFVRIFTYSAVLAL